MADYKIVLVSAKPPRTWSFTDKRTGAAVPMETYKVMLEGMDEVVDVNRKPGKAPTVGEVLTGSLETTDFGFKFKKDPRQGTAFAPKDQETIRAQWAIGQAVVIFTSTKKDTDFVDIEKNAKEFYVMVDRVKDSAVAITAPAPQSGYDKAKAMADKVRDTFGDGTPIGDEPIDLSKLDF